MQITQSTQNTANHPKEHKVNVHPAMRVRRNPVNPDNTVKQDKLVKPAIMPNMDMPTETVKSDGRLPLPGNSDMSGNKYEGLEGEIKALGGQITRMGAMCAIGLEAVDPVANWTKGSYNPETDEGNKEVTQHVGWTLPGRKSDIAPERPKRPTYAQMAQPDLMRAYREELRKYRDWQNVLRTGQGGPIPMGADIPRNLDTNDATADIAGTWTKFTRTTTRAIKGNPHNKRERLDDDEVNQMVQYRTTGGESGKPGKVLETVIEDEGWTTVTSYGSARKGQGGRILVKVSPKVHSDGKWTTRTRTVYSDIPGKGHIFHYSVIGWHVGQFGQARRLADFKLVNSDNLVLIGRFMPYEDKEVIKGDRLTSDNLGIRPQDGKTDIECKRLELDGKNPRVRKAAKAARDAKAAKAAKRAEAANARDAIMSDLAALAEKVHAGRKAPFAPMTRAEREITEQIG